MALRVMLQVIDESNISLCGTSGDLEPAAWMVHLDGTGKPPSTGEKGTVYERQSKGGGGPSSEELVAATTAWLKENKPEAWLKRTSPL